MRIYKLSKLATIDLDEIFDYTWENFGEEQAIKYRDNLKHHINLICQNPKIGAKHIIFTPPVHIFPSGAHLIIYQFTDKEINIIRFIHKARDLNNFFQTPK